MSPPAAVAAFGDTLGLPRLLRHLPPGAARVLVRAAIRPEQAQALEALAESHRLELLVQPPAKDPAYPHFADRLRGAAPELILVDSYSMLLLDDVLGVPARGAFNLHGALLPAYRGPNPIQWALINGERETGVTLHHMTADVDAGDIVAQRRVPIRFDDTWRDVAARIDEAAEELLSQVLPAVLAGSAPRRPQDERAGSRFGRRRPDDGRIDWGRPVREVYNLVRALVQPLPGAFYVAHGTKTVLDRYLSVSEVAALKYGPGGARLGQATAELRPEGTPGNDRVGLGSVELRSIDWERGEATLDGAGVQDSALAELAARFAFEEFELETVAVPARHEVMRRPPPLSGRGPR